MLVALVLVLAAVVYAWLRYEYSRAEIVDTMAWWRQVPVSALFHAGNQCLRRRE